MLLYLKIFKKYVCMAVNSERKLSGIMDCYRRDINEEMKKDSSFFHFED